MQNYLSKLGIINPKNIYHNLTVSELTEHSIKNGEGQLAQSGALVIKTGKYTGRVTDGRFIVDTPTIHKQIAWGNTNKAITLENYLSIKGRVMAYLQHRNLYVFDGFAGADKNYQKKTRIITEFASQNMFIQNLLVRPQTKNYTHDLPDINVICAPNFYCNPEIDKTPNEVAILLNIEAQEVIICGTLYSGEIKKSIFTLMNYLLPQADVLPMHCSANQGKSGDVAIFFGLSGTGKTTLSTSPNRNVIGDDEHGWSNDGIFNIEGGLYAKCLNLTKANEPQIFQAIRHGALVENVVIDLKTRDFDYTDASLTQNSRVGFPDFFIPNVVHPAVTTHPKNVIFLTADAFGVLPPVSKLTKEQAAYHFLSGYTSKVAGTEQGITEPLATFSTCFGEPFLPLPASIYAKMLQEKIEKYQPNIFLVNTGWAGGSYGVGKRMPLTLTRSIIDAIFNDELTDVPYEINPIFNLAFPKKCISVDATKLNPQLLWEDKAEYDATAQKLANLFIENFTKYTDIPESIIASGPSRK